MQDLADISEDLADIILESGLFDIKFEGAAIESIKENGDSLDLYAKIRIGIPDDEARAKVLEALNPQKEEEAKEDE